MICYNMMFYIKIHLNHTIQYSMKGCYHNIHHNIKQQNTLQYTQKQRDATHPIIMT